MKKKFICLILNLFEPVSTGFLIVAACVMIFESRDSAGKIAPVSANSRDVQPQESNPGPIKVNIFLNTVTKLSLGSRYATLDSLTMLIIFLAAARRSSLFFQKSSYIFCMFKMCYPR